MNRSTGFSMLEVLVSIVVIAIGLLGLAGLQARLQAADIEAYQRSQALLLLSDMADRIATNRDNAAFYVANNLGTAAANCAGLTGQLLDTCEWGNALNGTTEIRAGASVGTLIGARGCITPGPAANRYVVTIAWQGLGATQAPAVACGQGLYNTGGVCANDLCRRAVSTVVQIGTLP